jgi:quercetin dioxygenase-like cupin family protein
MKGAGMYRNPIVLSALFGAGIVVGFASWEIIHAQGNGYSTRQVIKTDLQNIPGQEVLIFASDWSPGYRLPWHIHPDGHEWTYVVQGEQTFEIEGVGTKVIKAGEVLYTPPNIAHFGRNATDKMSKTVVLRIKDQSKPVMVEVQR